LLGKFIDLLGIGSTGANASAGAVEAVMKLRHRHDPEK
jgi:hypothetical protein